MKKPEARTKARAGEAQEEKSRQHSILPVTAFPSCSSTSNCSIILRFKSPWVWIDVMQRFLKRSVQKLPYQGHIYAQACEIRLAFIKLLSFSKQTTLTTLRYWRKGNVFFPNRFSLYARQNCSVMFLLKVFWKPSLWYNTPAN